MIKIFRYSEDGFVPKVQKHHLNILKNWMKPEDYHGLNDYQISLIEQSREENEPNLSLQLFEDFQEGIFAWIDSLPENLYELNHLTEIELKKRKLFVGEIEDEVIVYSCYKLVPIPEKANRMFPGAACYIPKRSLT